MEQFHAAVSPQPRVADVLANPFARELAKPIERLPFTIKRVQTDEDMRKAVQIRHAAYARHVPEFAQTLLEPELSDYDDSTIVLLAESKLDGSPLGSMRMQTNQRRQLSVEESIALPAWLQGRRLAEVTRLGIDGGRIGRLVKIALIKACFEYCEDNADRLPGADRPRADRPSIRAVAVRRCVRGQGAGAAAPRRQHPAPRDVVRDRHRPGSAGRRPIIRCSTSSAIPAIRTSTSARKSPRAWCACRVAAHARAGARTPADFALA